MMYGHITFTLLIQNIKDKKLLLWFIFAAWCANLDYLMPGVEHDGITHTLVYAIPITVLGYLLFKWEGVVYGIVGQIIHMLLDTGMDMGIMWLYPLSTQRFSLNLWKATGALGMRNYYTQPVPLLLETLIIIGLIVRYHKPATEYLKKKTK
jgi:membrane-bound metal-dependent hydrolase YbcI (DUF457 family)